MLQLCVSVGNVGCAARDYRFNAAVVDCGEGVIPVAWAVELVVESLLDRSRRGWLAGPAVCTAIAGATALRGRFARSRRQRLGRCMMSGSHCRLSTAPLVGVRRAAGWSCQEAGYSACWLLSVSADAREMVSGD